MCRLFDPSGIWVNGAIYRLLMLTWDNNRASFMYMNAMQVVKCIVILQSLYFYLYIFIFLGFVIVIIFKDEVLYGLKFDNDWGYTYWFFFLLSKYFPRNCQRISSTNPYELRSSLFLTFYSFFVHIKHNLIYMDLMKDVNYLRHSFF